MHGRVWTVTAWLAVALAGCGRRGAESHTGEAKPGESHAAVQTSRPWPSNRVIYPWSIVPGGVDSPEAMRQAMAEDPLVRLHYADLDPDRFRPGTLPEARQGYVSYRVRDQVYWTRKPVTLKAGELVLTDGTFLVRGRCGNLYSPTPRLPVAPAELEPLEERMEVPVRESHLAASPPFPAAPAPATGEFHNPMTTAADPDSTAVLGPPPPEDLLPPVWIAGGANRLTGAIVGVPTSGGGPGAFPPSTPMSPVDPLPTAPAQPAAPFLIPAAPVETAPPLVTVSLLIPPEPMHTPAVPIDGTPWFHPIAGLPNPPIHPPGLPPLGFPPIETPPPTGNPPVDPPHDPPPPPEHPPPADPPRTPPADSPPEVLVPEPGAWVLLLLGLAAIAAGAARKKS